MTERTIRPRPFAGLRRHGLRVTRHLDIRAKYVDIHFEVPTQLNSAPMLIYKSVSIGAYTYLRSGILKHVESIGRYSSLGPNVILGEGEHPMDWLSTSPITYMPAMYQWYAPEIEDAPKRLRPRTVITDESTGHGQVTIGNDVWIGTNAMVRRGVHIGDGAVIGAGAYVNRDVEPYSIVAGVPARVIRMRFDDATIEALLALRWWEFHANDLIGVPFESPADAIPMIEDMEAAGTLTRWPVTYRTARLTRQGYTRILGVPRAAKAAPPAETPTEQQPPPAEAAVAAVALQGLDAALTEDHADGANTEEHAGDGVFGGTAFRVEEAFHPDADGGGPTPEPHDPFAEAVVAALAADEFDAAPDPEQSDAALSDPEPLDDHESMTEAVLAALTLEGLEEALAGRRDDSAIQAAEPSQLAAFPGDEPEHANGAILAGGYDGEPPAGAESATGEPTAPLPPEKLRFIFPWNR